jgi:HAD superfamily hydrolase (TIGR01509 family)
MIKSVIFDIDGVLIDSLEGNWKLFCDSLKIGGYKKLPTKSQYKRLFHLTARDTFKAIIGNQNKKEINRLVNFLLKDARLQHSKIVRGSIKIIAELSKNYSLALVTSRLKVGVEAYLKQSKTRRYFKIAVCFGEFKNPKPHPESLLIACKRLKVNPLEAVYVGDAHSDVLAAKAAGMKIIVYPKRIVGADAYAKSFAKIPKIVASL